MVVMPRESWTDERLDDFRGEVNRRFDETNRRMEAGFSDLREEMHRIHARLDLMDGRFDAMNARFDAMQRALMTIGFVLSAALIGLIATQL